MIMYDSKIARLFTGRLNPYDYVTLMGVTFTTVSHTDKSIWDVMETQIHCRQYAECFWATLLPSVLMGFFVWWGLALLPLFAYYILYWAEMLKLGHSAFNFEAEKECEEVCYFVMRKRFAWRKWYWKKELPPIKSIWDL